MLICFDIYWDNIDSSLGYDAALYSAASSYISQQSKTNANTWQKKPIFQKTTFTKTFTKPPPKQTQLHYCEVCKISCAGPMVSYWAGIFE